MRVPRSLEQLAELRNFGCSSCCGRPRRYRMDTNSFWADLCRYISHGVLQRCFHHTHDVVVLHHDLASVIRHGEERSALFPQRVAFPASVFDLDQMGKFGLRTIIGGTGAMNDS